MTVFDVEHQLRCAECGELRENPHYSYCRACKNARMRSWRREHPLTEEQRRRDNARSYAGVYLRRGKLTRQPCERCGSPDSQMHHDDYDKPLEVRWLCRPCHLAVHETEPSPAVLSAPSIVRERRT